MPDNDHQSMVSTANRDGVEHQDVGEETEASQVVNGNAYKKKTRLSPEYEEMRRLLLDKPQDLPEGHKVLRPSCYAISREWIVGFLSINNKTLFF